MIEKPTYEELEQRVRELKKAESERKLTEEALLEKERKYRLFAEGMNDILWTADLDMKTTYLSPSIEKVLGFTVEERLKQSLQEQIPSETLQLAAERLAEELKFDGERDPKRHTHLEIDYYHKDGSLRCLETSLSFIRDEHGKPVGIHGISRDITDRKQAEESVARSAEEQHILLENIQTQIWYLTDDHTYGAVNKAHADFLGVQIEDLAFKNMYDSFPEDVVEVCRQGNVEVFTTGRPVRSEEWLPHVSGERRLISILKSPKLRADGTVEFVVCSAEDITERKQAEAEREKLQEQLNQARKMESVGRLAGGVAHNLNNMLGVILGHTELALLKTDENHDLHSDLKEIQKAAKRSADTTKQLLAFARKEIISPKQIDLNDTVENILNMLRRLIGENIDLVWKPAAHLWPVKMDPTQIDQILANLCVNARDAIAGVGKLTIETGRHTFDEEYCNDHPGFIPGAFVLLAVSDNGCGMDNETLNNLFEPFFTTKEVGKGTGLGLATVYGIVKQNNGFINVYSEPGQGSTFKIYLPRLVDDKKDDKAVPAKKAAAGGTETILLVEDESTILGMTRMMLERKGYSVLPAATPAEALDLAKAHADKIHLLMTDVVMPEMNGRNLAEQISALYPDIKLLFMSGYTANVIAHQGILDDGVAFIQKPFSMADMTAKIREVLDTASDRRSGQ
jgi:PAS domain S-box-containing protein